MNLPWTMFWLIYSLKRTRTFWRDFMGSIVLPYPGCWGLKSGDCCGACGGGWVSWWSGCTACWCSYRASSYMDGLGTCPWSWFCVSGASRGWFFLFLRGISTGAFVRLFAFLGGSRDGVEASSVGLRLRGMISLKFFLQENKKRLVRQFD